MALTWGLCMKTAIHKFRWLKCVSTAVFLLSFLHWRSCCSSGWGESEQLYVKRTGENLKRVLLQPKKKLRFRNHATGMETSLPGSPTIDEGQRSEHSHNIPAVTEVKQTEEVDGFLQKSSWYWAILLLSKLEKPPQGFGPEMSRAPQSSRANGSSPPRDNESIPSSRQTANQLQPRQAFCSEAAL